MRRPRYSISSLPEWCLDPLVCRCRASGSSGPHPLGDPKFRPRGVLRRTSAPSKLRIPTLSELFLLVLIVGQTLLLRSLCTYYIRFALTVARSIAFPTSFNSPIISSANHFRRLSALEHVTTIALEWDESE